MPDEPIVEPVEDDDKVSLLADDDKDVTLLSDDDKKKDTADDSDGDDSTQGKGGKADEPNKDDAPKYEAFNIPDGQGVDEEKLSKFTEAATAAKLSQEDAQSFVDLYVDAVKEAGEEHVKAWADVQAKWVNDAKEDKEIGGDKFQETIVTAKTALKVLGNEQLIEALNVTGMGNHPEFIRFFAKVGRAIGEDGVHFGRGEAKETTPIANRLFPNQN